MQQGFVETGLSFLIKCLNELPSLELQRVGGKEFPPLIRDSSRIYNWDFITILEPRISGLSADNVIKMLRDFLGVCSAYEKIYVLISPCPLHLDTAFIFK